MRRRIARQAGALRLGRRTATLTQFTDATIRTGTSDEDLNTNLAENDCPTNGAPGLITFQKYDCSKPNGTVTNTKFVLTNLGGQTTSYTYDAVERLSTAETQAADWDPANADHSRDQRMFTYGYDQHSALIKTATTGTAQFTTPSLQTGTQWANYNLGDELCASTWRLFSGIAHARPWAAHFFLDREVIPL